MIKLPSFFRRPSSNNHPAHERKSVKVMPDTNNRAAQQKINKILADLSADGGGTVILAAGVHVISKAIRLRDNTRLRGVTSNGRPVSWIILVDDAAPFGSKAGLIRIKERPIVRDETRISNVTVEDLFVDGNRTNQRQDVNDDEKKYGLYSESINLTIRRVTIRNCMGYGFDPHGTSAKAPSTGTIIEDCLSYGNLLDGYTLDHQAGLIFRRNKAYGNGRHGINAVSGSHDCLLADNVTRANKVSGITVQNSCRKIRICGNLVEENEGKGIYLRGVNEINVERNKVRSNGDAGIHASGTKLVTITNNEVERNARSIATKRGDVHVDSYKNEIATETSIKNNAIVSDRTTALFTSPECSEIDLGSNKIIHETKS